MKIKTSILTWLVLLGLISAACSTFSAPAPLAEQPAINQTAPPPQTPTPTAAIFTPTAAVPHAPTQALALDLLSLKNASYRLPEIAYYHETFPEIGADGTFQLQDGKLELASPGDPMLRLYINLGDLVAFGDLDGDGAQDAVAVLAYNSGGTGTFIHLAAILNRQGAPEMADTLFLGDRVIVQQILVRDGLVVSSVIAHGPEDGACCPTQPVSLGFLFQDGSLVDAIAAEVGEPAKSAIQALKNRDFGALAEWVHPELGLRFSPYAYVQDADLVFQAGELPGLMATETLYQWGVFDGSGEPIEMRFVDYYERFIYTRDFASSPQISYNQRLGFSSMIDNSREFYPLGVVVEYHFPGQDPQYGGLDWRSLRLVFLQEGGSWYLIGIINDEWTT